MPFTRKTLFRTLLVALAATSVWLLGMSFASAGTDPAAPADGTDVPVVDDDLPPDWASGSGAGTFAALDDAPPSCDGDGTSGQRVQLLYVRGDGQADRLEEHRARFDARAVNLNTRLVLSAVDKGERREFRFVHDAACKPTITRVVVPQAAMDNADKGKVIDALKALGFGRADRKYVVWTENDACGLGYGGSQDQTPGSGNLNNHQSGWAMVGMTTTCFDNPNVDVHELLHTMGAVNPKAPYATSNSHCYLIGDLMCYDDGGIPDPPGELIDCPNPLVEWVDCAGDSYFNPKPVAGGYLASNWNIADSVFLIGGLAPGIPMTNVLITNKASNLVADLDFAGTANGTLVKLENEHAHPAQRWNLKKNADATYRIIPVMATGKSLERNTDPAKLQDGTSKFTHIWTATTGANQKWRLDKNADGTYLIVATAVGCLTGQTQGKTLKVLACNGTASQKWTITV